MPEHIRVARTTDAAAIAGIYAHYVRETAITFELEPPAPAEFAARIETCLLTHPWLVAQRDDRIVGYAYAGRFSARPAYDWSAEITVYLDHACRGQGLGTRLYGALVRLLHEQGYHALYAGITLPNPASLALHHAIGMADVGIYREAGFKDGRWHDVGWYGMTVSPSDPPAIAPLTFADLASQRPQIVRQILG